MPVLVSLVPELVDGKVYVHLFQGTSHERVGPLEEGTELKVLLEPAAPEAPKGGVSKSLRRASKKEEHKLASDMGGRRQPGSGSTPGAKGDTRLRGKFRQESKVTTTASYRVTLEELEKIRSETMGTEKPVFVVTFLNPRTQREVDRWVLIPYQDWHDANEAHFNR